MWFVDVCGNARSVVFDNDEGCHAVPPSFPSRLFFDQRTGGQMTETLWLLERGQVYAAVCQTEFWSSRSALALLLKEVVLDTPMAKSDTWVLVRGQLHADVKTQSRQWT